MNYSECSTRTSITKRQTISNQTPTIPVSYTHLWFLFQHPDEIQTFLSAHNDRGHVGRENYNISHSEGRVQTFFLVFDQGFRVAPVSYTHLLLRLLFVAAWCFFLTLVWLVWLALVRSLVAVDVYKRQVTDIEKVKG